MTDVQVQSASTEQLSKTALGESLNIITRKRKISERHEQGFNQRENRILVLQNGGVENITEK